MINNESCKMEKNPPLPTPLIWTTPSRDSSGSMPLGNGDIGLNVWVEQDGDLLFYLSKTDAWDENARLLKLGRLRVSLSPNPFVTGAVFRQELDVASGCICIRSEILNLKSQIRLWVDANQPVVRLEIEADRPVEAKVALELWRTGERTREGAEGHGDAGLCSPDERETVYPDTVIPVAGDAVVWCHRNRSSCWAATLEHQHMGEWVKTGHDPLLNRTFGALLRGDGLVKAGEGVLRTVAPQSRITLSIHPLTAQTDTLDEWTRTVTMQAARNDASPREAAFAEHVTWWRAFWERSWIRVSGTTEAETVSRGYELQRFLNACGGRGAFPIKFNGSIFTVDAREQDENYDADYRRWGGGYWFQNTRLTYWPMIMSGDFDLMEPWFKLYLDALPFAMARAKTCFGIADAALFPETMTFWGTFLNSNYGYNRGDLQPGLSENAYIRRYWQGMIELLAVLLDAYAVSGDESLLHDKLLVLAPPFLRFYRDYYVRRDDDGKILFKPAQSLETWHDAVNPTPDIAGLQWVLDGLLALGERRGPPSPEEGALRSTGQTVLVPTELLAEWKALRDLLPPLPTRTYYWEKRKEVIPALQYDDCKNSENCALYAVFPYRLFGIGKPELEVGRATWAGRPVKDTGGWRQDAIQAALLGLTEEAKAAVVKNFSTPHTGSRFPAFWGPNFDWVPDQDHGSAACIALQYMVLQADHGTIQLLPAWPEEWSVEFKLHAPGRLVVTGKYVPGKPLEVTKEIVDATPSSRLGTQESGEGAASTANAPLLRVEGAAFPVDATPSSRFLDNKEVSIMTSRERTKRAIHFQGVDHIPHYLPDGKENDILWLWTSREPDPQPWAVGVDGLEHKIDAWGTTWTRPVGEGNHGEKTSLPIPDIARQAEYVIPDQNNPRHFEGAREAIRANNASANPKYCLGVMPVSSLNEGAHNLLGLDNLFIAYYENPDETKALIARLADAQRDSIRSLHAAGCDGVMGYDDWGLQDRMMVGFDLIEEFFMPHYMENWKLAHDLGMDVWLHSCGYILPLLPRLQAWGLDVIQQDQQENMGLENLDAAVGGKLAFWCPVDIQQTMINGSLDDIRAYVRRMIATLGNHQGGLVSMAYSTPDVIQHTPEKLAAMCTAFREYGKLAPDVEGL